MHFTNIVIKPPIIAHRGASALAPENTLAALKKAKALGATWIEVDVMLTGSGEVVVIHDETLSRTTNGSGQVLTTPYSLLQTLDAGSWFNPAFSTEKIPTLIDVLDFLLQAKMAANIELKAVGGYEEKLVKHVMEIIKAYPQLELLLSSFSRETLTLLRQYSPKVLLGFLMHEWQYDWKVFCETYDCATVNVNEMVLTEARVAEIKAFNKLLACYVVNDPARAKQLFAWGVDAVFSDCPEAMLKFLK